ncbi:MAG: fatty acid--CoA ligase family protein [Pseudorhodoferax sp.]
MVLDRQPGAADAITTEYLLDVRSKRQTAGRAAYLLSMPMHHGSGPGQLWSAQRSGALTVLQRRFDAEEALALIARHRLTHWTGVPTMYKRIAALPPEAVARHDLSSLQQLTVGAAPVSAELKRWIITHLGDFLHEGYGSTETGMITHMPPAMQQAKPGSSGLPYRHVRIEIRGADGQALATGETGEIWAWTPTNIRHYLNAPPLDAETLDARGYFRTGDMGHLDADGYLWISDRAKDMVIAGGVNIYPAEIEAALLTHPALADAAVIGIPDEEMGERVMAFCEPKPGHGVTEDALFAHCAERLASYKRPRAIRIVDELPRNTVGKLLKRELRAPFWKNHERQV